MVVPELPRSRGPDGGVQPRRGRRDTRWRRRSTGRPRARDGGRGAGHVVAVGQAPHHRRRPSASAAEEQGPVRDRLVPGHAHRAHQGPAALDGEHRLAGGARGAGTRHSRFRAVDR